MAQSVPGRYGGINSSGDPEWEAREVQRQRELEEARARAAQMEKTMKWWSDCTANWREKWSKVRNERNKAREESKQLRTNLEVALKEANSYKREKTDLEMQITQLKREMDNIHSLMMKHAGQFNKIGTSDTGEETEGNGRDENCSPDISSDGLKNINSEDGLVTKKNNDGDCDRIANGDVRDVDVEDFCLKGAIPKRISNIDEVVAEEARLIQQLSRDEFDEDYLLQKISILQLRLDEAQRTMQAEREENHLLRKNIDKLTVEIQEIRERQEDLRTAKQEAVRELLTLQEQHSAEMRIIKNTLQEETLSRENLERRLSELRTELERLQAENASEWGKRERLETEKISLERDNKKLRTEIRDYQDRFDRKVRPLLATDAEVRTLQQELSERNKELSELKVSHSKLKKMLSESNTELGHTVRRAEQYETEVKRLRQRVEELKRELAAAEDEIDSSVSQVRRLQRANDELIGKTENLQTQVQHLQARPVPKPPVRGSSIANSTNGSVSGNTDGVVVQCRNKIVAVELSNECLPNINDLRQIFDEIPTPNHNIGNRILSSSVNSNVEASIKRSIHTERTLLQQQQTGGNYLDYRSTHIEEQMLESKSRNLDFEKAKQRFDNPVHLRHQHRHHHQERLSNRCSNDISPSVLTTNNRANLVLPLKSIAAALNINSNITSKTNTHFNLSTKTVTGSGANDGEYSSLTFDGDVVGANVFENMSKLELENSIPTTIDGNCSRNGVNLDSLKISDNEVRHHSYGSTNLLFDEDTKENNNNNKNADV